MPNTLRNYFLSLPRSGAALATVSFKAIAAIFNDLTFMTPTINSLIHLGHLSALLCLSGTAHAYPDAPNTWAWRYHEDSSFHPNQIAATTDPDGRLRTLFTDRQGFRYFTENAVQHRVHHVIMQSFRPLGTTLLNDFAASDLGDYTSLIGRDASMSDAASLELRRNFVFATPGPAGTIAYGGSYRRLLANETFGDEFFPSNDSHGDPFPLTGRKVLDGSKFFNFTLPPFGGAEGNVLAAYIIPGATQNRVILTNRSDGDIRLTYYENDSKPNALNFFRILSTTAGATWATDRIITGGHLAVTPDRRDFYALITSYKILANNTLDTECRLFRLRTATTTSLDGDGEPIIDIASVTTTVLQSQNLPSGTALSNALKYPTILLTSTGLPKWACWEDSRNKIIHFVAKNAVTTGTAEENIRSIANGYETPFAASIGGFFANGASGPSFALDRLDRLHLVYQDSSTPASSFVRYSREKANGDFENSISLGTCTSAPAITIGPGDYPYIVYKGHAPASGAFDKLVIAYPSGLADAYRGDYEDQDNDGRSGLLELAQGSSDTLVDAPNSRGPAITTVPAATPGSLKPRLTFVVADAATYLSQEQYQITQGTDTINIRLAYSYDNAGLITWSTGGFTRVSEVPTFGVKLITADDNITIGPALRSKGFYRLQVTRTPGAP